ncbi:MAG: tetratricopeptide repeat protein [Gemmatimonadota bacterium]
MIARAAVLFLVALAACAPKRIHEEPIIQQGDRVGPPDAEVAATANQVAMQRAQLENTRDSLTAVALATCSGDICAAVNRGEVMLGMNEAQVMAATGTTAYSWSIRDAGNATVLVPRSLDDPPRDAVADLALVQLRDGQVMMYSYREAQGVRVVSKPEDATTQGRANALADMLIREGDDYTARGDLEAALNRYDRADVLRPNDPELTYRIATTLDKALRPVEALIQYQLFLHQMELEKIQAYGDVYAKMAAAMVQARQRVIILEKQTSNAPQTSQPQTPPPDAPHL